MATDRLSGFNMGVSMKVACCVTSTKALTLSGVQVVDGITVGNAQERVLERNATSAINNGIYIADSSSWLRARDCDGNKDLLPGSLVYVDRGTAYGRSFWVFNSSSTAASLVVGTDSISLTKISNALGSTDDDVTAYGAVGDGVTDDTVAIQSAFNVGIGKFPAGIFKISSALTISQDNLKVVGAGRDATQLVHYGTTTPCIYVNAALTAIEVSNMTITRSSTVTAASGGNGIDFGRVGSFLKISDVIVRKQYRGVVLGPTDYSFFSNSISEKNVDNGVHLSVVATSTANGACQWQFTNILSAQNGHHGFYVTSTVGGPTAMALGEILNCATYANTGRGFSVTGTAACPVHGVRILGGFFGEDADNEVDLDTYGDLHKVENVFTELAGKSPTGPTLSSTASAIGTGIAISVNNKNVLVGGCWATNHSKNGIFTNSSSTVITGCSIHTNSSYGVFRDVASSNFILCHNNFYGNVAGAFIDGIGTGSRSVVSNNIGYYTEISGSAVVSSGTITVTFDHGLEATPNRVFITRGNAGDSSGHAYVSAVSSTSITISNGTTALAARSFWYYASINARL